METMQPWNQNYPQPNSPFRPNTAQADRSPGLSREEQLEAKRLSEEANFSFLGYQVVRREFMSHRFDPAMTIRGNSITFNNSCISKLENATYIQFLINPEKKKLLIRPCDEGARDAIRWCVVKGDKRKSRQITCRIFAERVYDMMGWDPIYRYRLQGMRITYNNEHLYLFDLTSNECFLPQKKDPNTGKVNRSSPIMPDEWKKDFGLNVEEHDMSGQIDLLDGFITASDNETDNMEETDERNKDNT